MKVMKTQQSLYYSRYCYFCQKVLSFLRAQNIELELRSTSDSDHKMDLVRGGGKTQVPCLRIDSENGTEWMYESDDIIEHLRASLPLEATS